MNRPHDAGRSVSLTAAEQAAMRYLDALEAGDIDAVEAIWAQAAVSPELEQLLCDVSDGLADELGLNRDWKGDVRWLKDLVHRHFPPDQEEPAVLTAGSVAARLQGDIALLEGFSTSDREANSVLLANTSPVPAALGARVLEGWVSELGTSASPRYWKEFRKVAVLLAMGRTQRVGELSAARKATRTDKGDKQ
ncbi:hypothetical protein [Zavarzinella formosa]|uniref:hypothetical protein n=1 Tax=Zavarzinella formosa TaxID=360055 RepID=UPI00035C1349|nr:hypothetical protein [Zavarzinella formosa]